jgi:hypothetical protein
MDFLDDLKTKVKKRSTILDVGTGVVVVLLFRLSKCTVKFFAFRCFSDALKVASKMPF